MLLVLLFILLINFFLLISTPFKSNSVSIFFVSLLLALFTQLYLLAVLCFNIFSFLLLENKSLVEHNFMIFFEETKLFLKISGKILHILYHTSLKYSILFEYSFIKSLVFIALNSSPILILLVFK